MPTILTEDGFRFFFYSREEDRCHIHVMKAKCKAKFWMCPEIEIADNYAKEIRKIQGIIKKNEKLLKTKWEEYFGN